VNDGRRLMLLTTVEMFSVFRKQFLVISRRYLKESKLKLSNQALKVRSILF
jgi:hypothetical protein